MLLTLFSMTILADTLAGTAMAQAPDAGCALPSTPESITGIVVQAESATAPLPKEYLP